MDSAEERAERWREHAGDAERRVLEAAVDAGRITGTVPFLVGGPVRDLILGIPFADIDLLTEGEGGAFAAELAGALKGELRRFPSFLTWRIEFPRASAVDITTARTESYAEPGALPQVSPARVEDDLIRRDFAANAVALNLFTGQLIDTSGGLEDIRERRLRILHPRSFLDDPARMLRGVRLATRLGFDLDPATSSALESAVAQNALESISRERVWREILLALREPSPADVLIAMSALRLLERFFFGTGIDETLVRSIEAQLQNTQADREVVYAATMIATSGSPGSALDGSGFSNPRAKKAATLMPDAERLSKEIENSADSLERLRLCARSGVETRVVASALSQGAAAIIEGFSDYQALELGIRGDELGLPYGPHIARALEATREALYLRRISNEEARDFARKAGLQYLRGEFE